MYGGSGTSPIVSSARAATRPGPVIAAARSPPCVSRSRVPPPTRCAIRAGPPQRDRRSARSHGPRSAQALSRTHARRVAVAITAPRQQKFDRSAGRFACRAGAPGRPACRSGRRTARAADARKFAKQCVLARPDPSIHDQEPSVLSTHGRARGDLLAGAGDSRNPTVPTSALCNALYKTCDPDNTITFTSPHDHPQGTFPDRRGLPGRAICRELGRTAGSSSRPAARWRSGSTSWWPIRLGRRRSPTLIRGQRRLAASRQAQHQDQGGDRHRVSRHRERRRATTCWAWPAATPPRWSPAATSACRSSFRCSWQVPGALQDNAGVLRDIGRGGAFVRTEEPLPSERRRRAQGLAARAPRSRCRCRRASAWSGQPGGEHGFGVEWKARDAGGTRRIKELVRRIEASGVLIPVSRLPTLLDQLRPSA